MTSDKDTSKAPTWDIESIFPGGSKSVEFAKFRAKIAVDLKKAEAELEKLPKKLDKKSTPFWAKWISKLQKIYEDLHLAGAFSGCLTSQNVNDETAMNIESEIDEQYSKWSILKASLESFSVKQPNKDWNKLLEDKALSKVIFYLNEMRDRAKMKMPEALEKLALELAVNGFHSWNRIYDKMAGDLRVSLDQDGQSKEISLGQNATRFSEADRAIRKDAFDKLVKAWESRANLATMTLNSLAGFRLSIYKNRGWDSIYTEPMLNGRMKKETLDAMWAGVAGCKDKMAEYINAKKKYLKIDKFCWYDQEAPMGKSAKTFSFDEAGEFIVRHLASFSDEMAEFTGQALLKRWVEAENRSGKAAGGWCSRIPIRKESRIFMTFHGNYGGLGTLAHELGHAYHGYVLKDAAPFAQVYPMNLAETASIFNELRVTDAAFAEASNHDEKLLLLDQKLQGAMSFFCNIRARFIFDSDFYEERKKGVVGRERLNEIMTNAQKEAFFGLLDQNEGYHPLFWASKLHFFLTGAPFYNFPYTFGFLFASGVYDRAVKEGKAFAKSYAALLADTGRMTTEQVAAKHLGIDLTKPDFWNDAVSRAMAPTKPFIRLCENS